MKVLSGKLFDDASDMSVNATVSFENGKILIGVEGYSDAGTADNNGQPIMIELWQKELRVVLWSDINREDPMHIINMEGAAICERMEENS